MNFDIFAEVVIDGELHYKTTPNGEPIKFTSEMLHERIFELEEKLAEQYSLTKQPKRERVVEDKKSKELRQARVEFVNQAWAECPECRSQYEVSTCGHGEETCDCGEVFYWETVE